MKTLTKQEAVAAFMRGEKVEFSHINGTWYAVRKFQSFDDSDTFRLADTDEDADAEWLRKSATLEIRQTQSEYYDDAVRVADRIERDKARISELERWKSEMLEVEREWDEQAVGLELGMTLGMPIRKNIMPYIKSMKERIAELEAEVARLKPDESKKPWTSIEYVSEPPAKGGDK